MVITAAQIHSTKPELRFCAVSNPARGVSEIRNGEDSDNGMVSAGNKATHLSSVNHIIKTIQFNSFTKQRSRNDILYLSPTFSLICYEVLRKEEISKVGSI